MNRNVYDVQNLNANLEKFEIFGSTPFEIFHDARLVMSAVNIHERQRSEALHSGVESNNHINKRIMHARNRRVMHLRRIPLNV